MSSQYHQPNPQSRDPQQESRLAQLQGASASAMGYRSRSLFTESNSEAWRGLRLFGFTEVEQVTALLPSELASKIPHEGHEALGKILWVMALRENHLPNGSRKLSAFDLAVRSAHLDIKHYEGMRTLVHFLDFNVIYGLKGDFRDPAQHAQELWDEMRYVGDILERHLRATYYAHNGSVPAEINRERGPRREACAWALEAAARNAWRIAAFGKACGNAASDAEIAKYQAQAERYALGVFASNGFSGHPDHFDPQASVGRMPDGARRRIAATLRILAALSADQGDNERSTSLKRSALILFRGSEAEDTEFLKWAHALPPPEEAGAAEPEPARTEASDPAPSPAPTKPLETQRQEQSAAPVDAKKQRLAIEPGLTWVEVQVFYADQINERVPNKAMDKVSTAWAKIASGDYAPSINLLQQIKEAHIDRRLIELSAPELRETFFKYADERATNSRANEKDVIEISRLLATSRFIARQPGMERTERHKHEQLTRRLETHGRKIAEQFGVRGLFGQLHDFFSPIFQ